MAALAAAIAVSSCQCYRTGAWAAQAPQLIDIVSDVCLQPLTSCRRSVQAHGPFLLITLVGVQPALQCQGIGSKLLRRVLRYADEHSLPSYLEVCPN